MIVNRVDQSGHKLAGKWEKQICLLGSDGENNLSYASDHKEIYDMLNPM